MGGGRSQGNVQGKEKSVSESMRFEYAMQDPALAIAPVFLARQKGQRKNFEVDRVFRDSKLKWCGPESMGMPEQSVLLGLLSIAGQQNLTLNPHNTKKIGARLLAQLASGGPAISSSVALVQTTWAKIVTASGYKTTGGKNNIIVKNALERMKNTTILEERFGIEYKSRLLAYIAGDIDGVTIILNQRATDALKGGQYARISLEERHALPDAPSKALHAWLSGHMRSGSTRVFDISSFQPHVWEAEAAAGSSTLRRRVIKLRNALQGIGRLPNWDCLSASNDRVKVTRIDAWTIGNK